TVMDLYLRLRSEKTKDLNRRERTDSAEGAENNRAQMRLSRVCTVAWAVVLFALAILCLHRVARVVEVGLQIASVAYGALLGAFLLGVLTRRANQMGTAIGMVCGFATELYLWRRTPVPWTWWVMIGTGVTFGIGFGASLVTTKGQVKSS